MRRKPEPTRLQKERFLKGNRFVYRVELVVDFDHDVTLQTGRETARKILDALHPELPGFAPPEGFGEASLKCSELRRLIRVVPGPPKEAPEEP